MTGVILFGKNGYYSGLRRVKTSEVAAMLSKTLFSAPDQHNLQGGDFRSLGLSSNKKMQQ